jgi:ABC-type transport system involved in multi-copper enzyme maturation permease subunit
MKWRISAIALNTFREAIRDRVLYNLVVFVLLLVASAPLFGEISIGMERLIVVNVGLTSISIFGVIIAIFIGIGLVSKEIEKRTLYTILSRPVRRWEFISGKYLGLMLTLAVNTALMTAGLYVALFAFARNQHPADPQLLVAVYFTLLELAIITAITLLFSAFSSPIFSAIFTFALFVIGTFAEDLRGFASVAHGLTRALATGVAYLVPNFASLNVIGLVAHDQHISARLIFLNSLYVLFYAGATVVASILIFERRNLK